MPPKGKKVSKKVEEPKFVPEVEEEEEPPKQVEIDTKNLFQPPDLKEVFLANDI